MAKRICLIMGVVSCALMASPSSAFAISTPVDLELSLLVDVSGSISTSEFNLQKTGYANAFSDPAVQSFITDTSNGRLGKIAVNLVYWSSGGQATESVGWTLLDSPAACATFANAISASGRPYSNSTGIGYAIQFATPLFASNVYEGTRQVIDVSGDGTSNSGIAPATARDAALAAGIDTVNGLAIGSASLQTYYESNVEGGTNSFTILANSFADFGNAVKTKLQYEITGDPPAVPEPLSLVALGLAVAGVGGYLRRRRAA